MFTNPLNIILKITIFKGFMNMMNIHEHNFPISEMGFVIYFAQGISSLQNTLFPPLWFLVHIVVCHKLAAYSLLPYALQVVFSYL
jgi:hypothetical protein